MEHIQTQKAMIREWIESGHSISAIEALRDFGCYRLASRISDLRKEGVNIKKTSESMRSKITGKTIRFARYSIAQDNIQQS